MPSYSLGQAAYVNKGTYSGNTAYAPLNTCYYNGGTWVALTNVTGVTPGSDNTKWLCITQGIKTATIVSGSGNATVTITLTDGTTSTVTIPLTAVADGTITVAKLASGFVLPAANGGTGRTTGAQEPINVFTGTLAANGWSSSTLKQALTINGLQTTSQFIAQPNNKAGWIAAQDATIYPPELTANTLTFECASIPSADIPVTVYWW